MSHMLERLDDGQYSIAYAGEVPWHGLGKKVLPDLTPAQMLKEAGLNWKVEKVPAYYEWNDEVIALGEEALIRTKDGVKLSTVSGDWEPVQNAEAFAFFDEFVDAGDMEMHTAGSLNGGRMVWALAKVKESFTLFGGDKVESYLLFSNPHQYGKCVDIRFTPIRVVCNNTLTLSLKSKAQSDLVVRLNHRRSFDPDMVKETLGIATKKLNDYKDMAAFLGKKKYKKDALTQYFMEVFPSTSAKKKDEMSRPAKIAFDIVDTQPGADFARGTFWSAFNAVTFTIDHLLGHNDNNRVASAWYGINRKRKNDALKLAVDYAEAA